ncbi:MAG: UvrD-helicase domain-containing protein [Candidatus Omnitrophica bacterium]|nr:UvrD-helicase domain-containing protein [Candidatus Omnitrophota bacterium]
MTQNASPIFLPPEVRVVEASAGSGKTYCLARRYVQLLLNPRLLKGAYGLAADQILLRNILAITFTNKAAYTMKARILEFLKKIALGVLSASEENEILRPIGLTLPEAKSQAQRIMDELIHHYNFFQVQTIDSFINSLLSGCAFKVGLSAGFKIKRNYVEYLEHSFDRMIDQSPHDKAIYETLARFLHNYLFLENKNGWFPKKDMLGMLKALYSQSNTYGRDFAAWSRSGDDIVVRKKKIMALLREIQQALPEGVHKKFREGLDNFLTKYHDGFDFDALSNYLSWPEVPVTKGVEIPKELDRLWERMQKQLHELSEAEAYSLFDPYVQAFSHINADFHAKAQEDDVLFLPELNRRARALFDDGMVSVEELYYRLATRFHHYLLDEFQDTSYLQWQNLELMIEEALSTGGTFFYVGDKKQAIYGFRGGEVKLFDEVKDRFAAFNVQLESLSMNYRSEKAVVEFNNKVFSPDNLKRYIHELQDEKDDALPLSPDDVREVESIFYGSQQQVQTSRDRGYVRVEYVEAASKDERSDAIRERLLSLIKELKERFSYNQIAILTRSNTEIEQVTSWLMAEGIFVESERTLNIKENPLILELIAFLQFLDSPIDNLSFAKFLSGDIFHKASGLRKEEIEHFLFSHRPQHQDKGDFYLYRAFRDRYAKVWDRLFDDFFKNVGLFPLYELTASILRRLEVFVHFPDEHGFFLRFLELIKEKEEEFSDLNSFLEHFEDFENDELFVNVVNSDAIKILTTHKAKGLEFPVVIIPFLGIKIHAASGGETGQQSYIVDTDEQDLKLLRIKQKYLQFSPKLKEIDRVQRVKSFISELNNTYVALTRAGKELYAFIPPKIGSSRNLIKHLIPPEIFENGKPDRYPVAATQQERSENQLGLPVAPLGGLIGGEHDWINFLKEEFTDSASVLRRLEIRRGAVLHDILSGIGNLHGADQKTAIQKALQTSRSHYPQVSDWKDYEDNIQRILDAPALKPFFVVPAGEVFLEKELINSVGQTRRVDRLIVKKNEIWIVDYKSSGEGRERFIEQVKEYGTIIAEIQPNIRVKGFLVYLDDVRFEEVL